MICGYHKQKRKAINLIFYADETVFQTKLREVQGPKEPRNSCILVSVALSGPTGQVTSSGKHSFPLHADLVPSDIP